MTDNRAVRILVEGRVQNVGYRVFVAREAGRLHLHGFVRNRHNGAVETFVEGPRSKIEEFLSLAIKGPNTVAIERHQIEDAAPEALAEFAALAKAHGADGFFSAPAL
ncbi:acylphosphatase [Methylocystis parvus]|uniref:acylphosphatase n=1 Tax=Methylocystis parvus TaxID=134 RepID=A0A6B8M7X1_9HYPH|nr:acylphosphatase [Methylocystis parvus]QGM97423.1 acylphosphatase [Methylocystis parvus]WBJ98662.1 acylphosphatase [Methylocystis parvus OBBP]